MSRCVIVSAAEIKNYKKIKSFLLPTDYFILCDAGLNHQEKLNITPNLIIGDFDSYKCPRSNIETIQLPCEKDDTDTFFAVKEALKRGFNNFLFIGVIGNRLDHSLCNISCLLYLYERNIPAVILDDYSEMSILGSTPVKIPDTYSYFSLMNITGDVQGVTIKNAKYPLENSEIKSSYMYGISNEITSGKIAEVSVKKGILLLIKIWNK